MEQVLNNDINFNLSFGYYKKDLLFGMAKFTIYAGKKHLVLGEPSCGKTTLLEIFAGLNKNWQGEANGKAPKDFKMGDSVSFLPSSPVLFENKSVYKNIEYAFKVLKIKKPYDEQIKELLVIFGLEGKEKIKAKKLCYVDRLKTCLARSYLKNANVLLVDDLFKNATTEEEIESIWHAFKLLDLGNKTLIMVLNKEIKPQIDFDYTLKIEGKKIVEENNK